MSYSIMSVALNVLKKLVYFFEDSFVLCYPIGIICPSIV